MRERGWFGGLDPEVAPPSQSELLLTSRLAASDPGVAPVTRTPSALTVHAVLTSASEDCVREVALPLHPGAAEPESTVESERSPYRGTVEVVASKWRPIEQPVIA